MKQGWAAVLHEAMQNERDTSFIGGLPRIPEHMALPKCQVCGEPLTFFFQVDFPAGHIWAGKTLAMFACIHSAENHQDQVIPQFPKVPQLQDCDLPQGFLEENYQDIFRVLIFPTEEGVMRSDYQEQAIFRSIEWKPTKKKSKKIPILLAGEPMWLMHKEHPATYAGKYKMHLILQMAEDFDFEHLPSAPKEHEPDYFCSFEDSEALISGKLDPKEIKPKSKPRKTDDYTLFCSFNRIYLFGTDDLDDPKPFIIVQNNV